MANNIEKRNSNALGQIKNFTSGLSMPQMAGIVGAVVVVIVGIFMLISSAYAPNMKTLYKGLPDSEASQVVDYLIENDIDYELRPKWKCTKSRCYKGK